MVKEMFKLTKKNVGGFCFLVGSIIVFGPILVAIICWLKWASIFLLGGILMVVGNILLEMSEPF